MKIKWIRTLVQYAVLLVLTVITALTVRIFAVDFYAIPSDSMRPELEAGDFILVNKLCYGARLYRNLEFLKTGKEPETWRTRGYSRVKRNDVVVFNYPQVGKKREIRMNLSVFYVKRCIGLPGDTLKIEDGYYLVNGRKGYGNMEEQQQMAEETTPRPGCEYRTRFVAPGQGWNIRNWGPLLIPAEGTKIRIDSNNVRIYDRMIAYEMRGHKFRVKDKQVWLNDTLVREYTFRQNWYFMAGDHIYNSKDSRYIGLVPEEFIVGKVSAVLYNRNRTDGTFCWDRFLRVVRGGNDD